MINYIAPVFILNIKYSYAKRKEIEEEKDFRSNKKMLFFAIAFTITITESLLKTKKKKKPCKI